MSVLFFFVIALLSEVIGTVAGFGSSVFFVPLAGLFLDFHSVLMLTSILHVFSNAAKLILFGRHVRLRLLLLFGVPSVCLVILRLSQRATAIQDHGVATRSFPHLVQPFSFFAAAD